MIRRWGRSTGSVPAADWPGLPEFWYSRRFTKENLIKESMKTMKQGHIPLKAGKWFKAAIIGAACLLLLPRLSGQQCPVSLSPNAQFEVQPGYGSCTKQGFICPTDTGCPQTYYLISSNYATWQFTWTVPASCFCGCSNYQEFDYTNLDIKTYPLIPPYYCPSPAMTESKFANL